MMLFIFKALIWTYFKVNSTSHNTHTRASRNGVRKKQDDKKSQKPSFYHLRKWIGNNFSLICLPVPRNFILSTHIHLDLFMPKPLNVSVRKIISVLKIHS